MRYTPFSTRQRLWASRARFALRALRARRLRDPDEDARTPLPWQPLRHAAASLSRHGRYHSFLACRLLTASMH